MSQYDSKKFRFWAILELQMNVAPLTLVISDALHHLASFVQFKKREKHPQRKDTLVLGKLRKVAS